MVDSAVVSSYPIKGRTLGCCAPAHHGFMISNLLFDKYDSSPERYTVINISLCQLYAGERDLHQSYPILISVVDSGNCGHERGRISPSFDEFRRGIAA